jgi:hypothetical protein
VRALGIPLANSGDGEMALDISDKQTVFENKA